jgi:hypothetical protein
MNTETIKVKEPAARPASEPLPRSMMRIEHRIPPGPGVLGQRLPAVKESLDWTEVVSWAEVCL